jgi:hypothetical protein
VIQVNEMIEVVVTHSPHKSKAGRGELFDQGDAFYICFALAPEKYSKTKTTMPR